jgi:ribosomal protein S18 acetylase RimI-like enzyme
MIRNIKSSDREQLADILKRVDQFNEAEVCIALELLDIAIDKPEQEDYYIYIYEEDGKVLGYHCTGKRPLTDGTYDLYWIVVDPDTQGMGIGKKLLKHAEDLVLEKKGRWLLAETSSKDSYCATRGFYQRNNYKIVTQINDFYTKNDHLIVFGKNFNN